MNILVLGSGGREKALQAALSRSPRVNQVHILPLPAHHRYDSIVQMARQSQINLAVVGPEGPLIGGVVDFFKEKAVDINIFGPSRAAAELEGSKIFMKTRCIRWGVPTARFDFAGSYTVAEQSIKRDGYRVIKADGLCAGKGVEIAKDEPHALSLAKRMLVDRSLGEAGGKIVLEEKLEGRECSILALCDGVNMRLFPPVRDYKRLNDSSDQMTGGMGAYSPLPDVDECILADIKKKILGPLIAGMRKEGRLYQGVLYAGVMLTTEGPKLLEVNCRFGDPETQVLMARLKSDLSYFLPACCTEGGLASLPELSFREEAAVCVCVASKEYPQSGSRLHSLVGTGLTIADARDDAYRKVRAVPNIDELQYRPDIAAGA